MNLHQQSAIGKLPIAESVSADDGTIQVNRVVCQLAPDRLISLAAAAREWGLEAKGLVRAARTAAVPLAKIGREVCARRSDLLAMVEKLAKTPPAPAASYEALVANSGRKR